MFVLESIRYAITLCSALVKCNRKSKVIFYHDVHSEREYTSMGTPMSLFKQHINIIKQNGFEITDSIIEENNQIMICFDDGFRGIWDNREWFLENKIHPTIFVSNSLIGKDNFLNTEEIKELKLLGFHFEGHTWSHDNLTQYDETGLERELTLSRKTLSEQLGFAIEGICFPQGYYSDFVIRLSEKAGYKSLYISDPQPFYCRVQNNLIPRYLVQSLPPIVFKAVLLGGMDVLYGYYIKLHKVDI